ncbi:MAG: MATE family efflux transporter [Clostridia bacterium]|nr:MATE family efflux transporter [Clostridia bacterium]
MTRGSIWLQLIQFALPMTVGLIFQQLYNTVDSIIVGQFVNKQALAAVGSTSSIINTLVGFSAGLSTGSSVIISQRYGAKDEPGLRSAVSTTLSLTFLLSVVLTLLSVFLVEPLLRMQATPEDVLPEASTYLRIYFLGLTGLLVYNMGSGILRAVGDSRRPLYFLIFSAFLNTVLDLLFVIKFDMGVAGVAYATIIAQFISALLVLLVLTLEHAPYGIRWKELRLHLPTLRKILSVGLPSGIQQALTSFSNVFVQSYINHFGSACMAGWSSCNKLDAFLTIPMQSIALASTTFVGQNYGANQLPRAREGVKKAQILSVGITLFLSAMIMIFARPLSSLISPDADVLDYSEKFIHIMSPFYFAMCFNQTYAGALRGIGKAKAPMFIMLFSFVLFRQIYLYVVKLLGNNLNFIALAYPVGWVMCSLLLMVVYHRSELCRSETQPANS